jgi:mRNA-degrading endonuclease toxin of MazEF toxin-antitoxin module
VKRGDVYEYVIGNHQARVVIVSAEPYNPIRAAFAVIRQPADAPAPRTVAVPIVHPVVGTVDLSRLRPLDPSALRARVGSLTVTALRDVDTALRTYLDL